MPFEEKDASEATFNRVMALSQKAVDALNEHFKLGEIVPRNIVQHEIVDVVHKATGVPRQLLNYALNEARDEYGNEDKSMMIAIQGAIGHHVLYAN